MTRIVIRGAHVITFDGDDLEGADILIDDTTITAVGRDLPVEGAEVIDAAGMLAIPGMADTHSHLDTSLFRGLTSDTWGMEFFTNLRPVSKWKTAEDTYAGVYTGAIELINNGITSVFEFTGGLKTPEHADATVQALLDAGIRAILGYNVMDEGSVDERFADAERTLTKVDQAGTGLLRPGIALSIVNADTLDLTLREIEFARGLGARMTFHNNKGGELVLLDRAGVLDSDILPAHGNWTTDDDLDALAACGGFLSTQPEAELASGRRPFSMVGRAHRRGIGVALGIDVACLSGPGILPQMRLLHLLQRYLDGEHERREGQVPVARRPGMPQLTTRDVLRFGTLGGAEALGWQKTVGRIAPGYQADLVLIDARTFGLAEGTLPAHVVLFATHADIDTVLVAGKVRKRAGKLVGIDTDRLLETRLSARRRVLAAAGKADYTMTKEWWDWVPDGERDSAE